MSFQLWGGMIHDLYVAGVLFITAKVRMLISVPSLIVRARISQYLKCFFFFQCWVDFLILKNDIPEHCPSTVVE